MIWGMAIRNVITRRVKYLHPILISLRKVVCGLPMHIPVHLYVRPPAMAFSPAVMSGLQNCKALYCTAKGRYCRKYNDYFYQR